MSWLGLEGKTVLVQGAANKKSVAYHVGKRLEAEGARVLWVVHTEARREEIRPRLGAEARIFVCDVRNEDEIDALAAELATEGVTLDGFVHSIAFANYSGEPGQKPAFHQTKKADFLDAVDVSAFSLVRLSNALRELFSEDASVVTISISTTRMAAENYGYMAPVKAALDSSVVFLAKSFSAFSRVRFNAVCAGLLKTASSAGIPGYLESYLYAERATLRGKGLRTEEVADTAIFLLSPRSSGVNAKGIVVDAGMDVNYFDAAIVEKVTEVGGG